MTFVYQQFMHFKFLSVKFILSQESANIRCFHAHAMTIFTAYPGTTVIPGHGNPNGSFSKTLGKEGT